MDQLRLAQQSGDPLREGIALNNLGGYYKDRRETAKAVDHLKKALEYFSILQDFDKKAAVLNYLGATYHETLAALWRASKRHGETLGVFLQDLNQQHERDIARQSEGAGTR